MNLMDTPVSYRRSPQGRISITIGKITADSTPHKAQPCHRRGTEVMPPSTICAYRGLVSERRCFPHPRFDPPGELLPWKDCPQRLVSGKRPDRDVVNRPSGCATLRSPASASRTQPVLP